MEDKIYSELLVELECPVCTKYMSPPIRQCSTGHSICEECRNKLSKCPLCKENFTDAKNLSLEALASKMHYPCINKDAGCKAKLPFNDRVKHEASCKYKHFKCGLDKCSWSGNYCEIESHWQRKKTASNPYGVNNICRFKVKCDFNYVNLVKAHNKLFWFKCRTMMGKVFWALQYIGNESEADGYFFQIELFKPGFPRRKAILSDYCQKIGEENESLFQVGQCIFMSLEELQQYITTEYGGENKLIYHFRVYKEKVKEPLYVKLKSNSGRFHCGEDDDDPVDNSDGNSHQRAITGVFRKSCFE